MRQDVKVHIEFVLFANLTDMQKRINQWITTGVLAGKYKTQINDTGVLFELILRKGKTI